MKKCPYCGEEIQEEAKKCRFCGEWLNKNNSNGENNNNILNTNDEFFTLEELKNNDVKIGYYPWRRYFAKMFDISIYITFVGLLIFFISEGNYSIENGMYEIVNKGELSNGGKLFFLLFFSYILIEPIFISIFSTTLGKKIMGIKVLGINKEKLSYKDCFLRTLMMYIKGLALGFPIISQIAMLMQYSNLVSKEKGYNTSYDLNKYSVLYKKVGLLSYILIIFLIIFLYLIPYNTATYNKISDNQQYEPNKSYNANINESEKNEIPKIIRDTANKTYEDIFYNELEKNENTLNEGLPKMITNDIRLDKILIPGNNSIQYNYTYVSILKSEIDVNNTIVSLKSEIINGIINSNDLKEYRKHNIKFIYNYKDKNGTYLFDISINPEDYNNINSNIEYPTDFSDI